MSSIRSQPLKVSVYGHSFVEPSFKLLSGLSAHSGKLSIARKPSQIVLMIKNFYLGKLNNKKFPHMVQC